MNSKQFQTTARKTAIYLTQPSCAMIYPLLGLVGECGEVSDKVKKMFRDDNGLMTEERSSSILNELGDCCWYVASVCSDAGIDLQLMYDMRGTFKHTAKSMNIVQLTLHMNILASKIAEVLSEKYYGNGGDNKYNNLHNIYDNISNILVCIEELSIKLSSKLEDVYDLNIRKLLSRKNRGTINGDGDDR